MTKIYKTYAEFEAREDKSTNGVSPEFAKENPNWEEDNKTNIGCWNCRDCRDCRDCRNCVDCRDCVDCSSCVDCRDCRNCYGCVDCLDCRDCVRCRDCRYCYDCGRCRDCSNCVSCSNCRDCLNCSNCRDCRDCWDCWVCKDCEKCKGCAVLCGKDNQEGVRPGIPVIHNIHQKVYEAATQPGALDMSDWHTCETTHCRAGWVIHLAGEAGYELEDIVGFTDQAALLIYEASSPIRVSEGSFYVDEEEALESMREAAEEEKKLNEGKP